MDHFLAVTTAKGSKVNSKVRDILDKVGGLVPLQPGALPANHMDRRKEQTELMPGLIIDSVKADRQTDVTDKFLRTKIIHIVSNYRTCTACDLHDQPHPTVRMKNTIKFMVISDCPSWQEEKAGKLLEGDAATHVKVALKAAGLEPSEGYYTTLVKAKKSDKFLSNAQLNGCAQYLERELELVKPAVIIALGSATIKRLLPGVKGSATELAGKVIYDAKLDASIVCGINPQVIYHNPDQLEVLKAVMEKAADILI